MKRRFRHTDRRIYYIQAETPMGVAWFDIRATCETNAVRTFQANHPARKILAVRKRGSRTTVLNPQADRRLPREDD